MIWFDCTPQQTLTGVMFIITTQRVKRRIISKQTMQHTYYIKVLPHSTVPTPKYFFVTMPSVRDAT